MTIRFPITAISSILHRITGILLFIALPILLFALSTSLSTPEAFAELKQNLNNNFLYQFVLWATLVSVAFHVIAGVRHIFMDAGLGESLEGGKRGALIVIILSAIAAVVLGVWVW